MTRNRISLSHRRLASALLLGAAVLVSAPLSGTFVASPAYAQAEGFPIIVNLEQFEALAEQGAVIVDVRADAAYERGHIPGAVNLPWQTLNVSEVDGIRNEFASDEEFERAFSAAGLSYDDTIVIYENSALPGRAYVAFEYAGFENVHVLDGGAAVWQGELSTDPVEVAASDFQLTRKNDIRVSQDYVADRVGSENAVIIDGRGADAFQDGHIPGAQSLPAGSLLTADRTLQSQPVLLDLLSSAGISDDREIVSYCGSGVAAANNYLALRNLGYENVVLYDASWDEWSRDPRSGQELSLANFTFEDLTIDGDETTPRFLAAEDIHQLADNPNVVILDVRSPSDFGAGHIPGSVNVFWNDTLDEDRVLRPVEDLRALYAENGVTPDKQVILFTRGGVQLSHSYTVLNLLGYTDIDFFTGKFEGWENPAGRG